jgi:hypothetical protein
MACSVSRYQPVLLYKCCLINKACAYLFACHLIPCRPKAEQFKIFETIIKKYETAFRKAEGSGIALQYSLVLSG